MNDSNLRRVSGLVGLVQKKREEFPLSFFPCPFKCICAERAVWQFGSIPISNSNLHPKSERHSNPIHSIQQREEKNLQCFCQNSGLASLFFVRLSFSEEVKSTRSLIQQNQVILLIQKYRRLRFFMFFNSKEFVVFVQFHNQKRGRVRTLLAFLSEIFLQFLRTVD